MQEKNAHARPGGPGAKILLFTFSPYDWDSYRKVLDPIFAPEGVELLTGSMENFHQDGLEGVDLVLTSAKECGLFISAYLPPEIPVLWINHTLSNEAYEEIRGMCELGPISVAADTLYYADQRRRMLINLGLPAQCFQVWGQECGQDLLCRQVIQYEDTPIDAPEARHILSISGRGLIAIDTLIQMMIALDRLDLVQSPAFRTYYQGVRPYMTQITDMTDIGHYYAYQRSFGTRTGCLLFTDRYTLYYCDEDAEYILKKSAREVIGKTLFEVFPSLESPFDGAPRESELLLTYGSKKLVFRIWTSETHGESHGYVLFSNYSEEIKKELNLRKVAQSKRHTAKYTFDSIQGESQAITRCKEDARRMALSSANVLITGSSGSGKELFAQAIHNHSPRRSNPFLSVNCGALVETLLESELFGYVSGAFTGASREGKAGVFELAHRGTLFLDEIGELPIYLQVKLLRVLQEREVVRVGGTETIPVDVRIVAATNRDLRQLVKEGKFRLDLYYRLNVLPLELPSLDQRREDILPLFDSMMQQRGFRFRLNADARRRVHEHHYEGNVRELQNCVEYLGSMGRTEITLEDLPPYMQRQEDVAPPPAPDPSGGEDLVLWAIREITGTGVGAGRRSIHRFLQNHGKPLSESQIRKFLHTLETRGSIRIQRGRGGIELL